MAKKILIVTFIVLVLVFGFIYFGKNFLGGGSNSGGTGSIIPSDTPNYPYMDIQTSSGSVRIQDYFSIAISSNQYDVVLAQEIGKYQISVSPQDNRFQVIILGHPLDKYQLEAEQKLLSLLKVREVDACKLNVKLGVPYSVDERFAGQEFAMSFCKGIQN